MANDFSGEWEDELKDTFVFNDGTKVEFSYGAPNEVFDLLLENPYGVSVLDMVKTLGVNQSQLQRDLEIIDRELKGVGKSIVIKEGNVKLSAVKTMVSPIIEPLAPSNSHPGYLRIHTNAYVPLVPLAQQPVGQFKEGTIKFELNDGTERKIQFKLNHMAEFFDIVQTAGSTHIDFDYIKEHYVPKYKELEKGISDETIDNYARFLSEFLQRNGFKDIRIFSMEKHRQIIFLTNYEF